MKRAKKNSRASTLANAIMFTFAVVIVRLFWLQIINAEKYKSLANKEQMKQYEIPAQRGQIFAMNGDFDIIGTDH